MVPVMENTYLLIDSNDEVVTSAVWDGVSDWTPPLGLRIVKSVDGHWHTGYKYDHKTGKAYDPNPPQAGELPRVVT